MIITNADEFVKVFGPGDTVYYTQSYCGKPADSIGEVTIKDFTLHKGKGYDSILDGARKVTYETGWNWQPEGHTSEMFVNDFFYGKLVATTLADAEKARDLLKAQFASDPEAQRVHERRIEERRRERWSSFDSGDIYCWPRW